MMDEKVISSLFRRVEDEPYARKLGMQLVALEPGHAIVEMHSTDDATNIFGMPHGGAIFSLIDEAFQLSCNSHGTIAVALNVNVIYHQPPHKGAKLKAESVEVHLSERTGTYEIRVTDDRNTLIASCLALAYRKGDRLPFLEEK